MPAILQLIAISVILAVAGQIIADAFVDLGRLT